MEKEKNNLEIYNLIKEVPKEAQKPITGGRLKGMTDIKPMWRIQKLTEMFGVCGIGWYTETTKKEIIEGANSEKIAVVDLLLFIKLDGEWSKGIEGSGGSSFIANEKNGLYTSDECFKMAYTDALSVACKSLGMAANVYWGDSKYPTNDVEPCKSKEEALKAVVSFGKYKDKTLEQIQTDTYYMNYILEKSSDEYLKSAVKFLIKEVTEEDVKLTAEFMDKMTFAEVDLEKVLETYKVEKVDQLSNDQMKVCIEKFNKMIKENKK